ncbi:MAG: PAS domain S-box protein, partial [Promethearchaeota archaeon]
MVFSKKNEEHIKNDNSFKETIDLYNGLMKGFPDLIVILNLEGKIVSISDSFQDLYGTKNRDDFIGIYLSDLIKIEDRESLKRDIQNTLKSGYLKMAEYTFQGKNNSSFIGELSLSILTHKHQKKKYFLGIIRDITNQKAIENELRENKQMFQLVMDNIPELISWKDKNSIYLGCNKIFARVAGLSNPSEIVGKSDYELPWKISEAESFYEIDQLVMDTNKPEQHIILPQLQADGKEAWLDANKIPLQNLDDNVVGLLSTYEDITDRLTGERALKKSEKRYREAYNKAEFYKDVFAHDVSNILQGILSSIEMCKLDLGDTKEEIKLLKYHDIIETQVNRGINLVSNIRKISSIDEMENSLTSIDVSSLIKLSLENVLKTFPKKQIETECDMESNGLFVIANNLLQDVFDNILHNAVKHNSNQIVKINVKVSKINQENNNYIKIEFIDNGMGILDAQKTIIFQRGSLDKTSLYRIGLGLSLVKSLVESYDGKIWVED